jgi:hypothetical protein
MALGIKELALQKKVDERINYLRDKHKEWMTPQFKLEIDWNTFQGFATAVGPVASHAVEGIGSPGQMLNDVTDILNGIYGNYKSLGPQGLQLFQAKVSGIQVQTDESTQLNVTLSGTMIVCHIPKDAKGNWSRGSNEISEWKKIIKAYVEA